MVDILLVEDNVELANLMKALLMKNGFSVCVKTTGEDCLKWLEEKIPKILILDIMLPGMDGFAVCQEVRKKTNIPILILSAKSEKKDQLLGFELGADDYLEKPVDLDILTAKIYAIWNRYLVKNKGRIVSGNLTIDIDAHQVFVNGKQVDFSTKEFELLLLLVNNEGKTLHKHYIFEKIWGQDSFSEEQTLTVHIKMLRDKIEDKKSESKQIITVWGIGYRYEKI